MSHMKIIDFPIHRTDLNEQAAGLLVDVFQENWPNAWPTRENAAEEVQICLTPPRINKIVVDDSGSLVGWIGATPQYSGRVWEIHPLAVHRSFQKKGIGTRLVGELEAQVRQNGGLTLWVGSDDESGQTSLYGKDLYRDLPSLIENIQNIGSHPCGFYQKLGFCIVGVMPDANGIGKPDIFLAKRVS